MHSYLEANTPTYWPSKTVLLLCGRLINFEFGISAEPANASRAIRLETSLFAGQIGSLARCAMEASACPLLCYATVAAYAVSCKLCGLNTYQQSYVSKSYLIS